MLKTVYFVIVLTLSAGTGFFANMANAAVDIFDSNRGKVIKATDKPAKPVGAKPVARGKYLDLTFVGVSEIDNTTLYFKDKRNKQIKIQLAPEKEVSLPGHPGLIIEKVENRVLYVQDVNKKYCRQNEKKGISCQPGKGVIEMKLVRKQVAAPARAPVKKNKQVKAYEETKKKREPGITRIDPKDVPEGKRLVRSPFGDRLVPK